ncbi:MAG: GNAT family N-acetyltransferase, partial [Kiloniellales bacterium]|nr:GNAT family N-acetyltransferase [Kiloniellales bacterium]
MSELAVDVRPADPKDAAAIAHVHVDTWRATYAGLLPDRYLLQMNEARQRLMWYRLLSQSAGHNEGVLVAKAPGAQGGQVVGFGSAGRCRVASLPFDGEVYTLYVAPDWQGQGLGRRLLVGLFRALHRSGLRSAGLWVLSGNPSRFFYEAMGGESCAKRQEPFAGRLLDETAYCWSDLGA